MQIETKRISPTYLRVAIFNGLLPRLLGRAVARGKVDFVDSNWGCALKMRNGTMILCHGFKTEDEALRSGADMVELKMNGPV